MDDPASILDKTYESLQLHSNQCGQRKRKVVAWKITRATVQTVWDFFTQHVCLQCGVAILGAWNLNFRQTKQYKQREGLEHKLFNRNNSLSKTGFFFLHCRASVKHSRSTTGNMK